MRKQESLKFIVDRWRLMPDTEFHQAANTPQKESASMEEHKHKQVKPSDTRISNALNAMHTAWESGVWRSEPDRQMLHVLHFITAVPPDALLPEEMQFIEGYSAALAEAQEFDAKGGA